MGQIYNARLEGRNNNTLWFSQSKSDILRKTDAHSWRSLECIQSFERGPTDGHTLLIPRKYAKMALCQLISEKSVGEDSHVTILVYTPENDTFLSLVQVALT